MARRPNRRRRAMPTAHRYERTDRVAQLVRSVVASEMERLDEAFEGTVITGVEVDRELSVAVVYYDVRDDDAAGSAAAAFDEHHHRLQRALGAGTSLRRTPTLRFRRDQGAVAAERIEDLLAGLSGEHHESELADNAAERDEPGER
ncbi:ribosome-binding factor A [Candidatus Poriferisodalis sp.]|uniref:ribosome-binding factor A n=1 Tax=Candidatus Poriferisodalis sp. TaxID=3101277 RepID=UPI003B02A415